MGEKARGAEKFIIVPACPTDAISLFFTMSSNLGYPIEEDAEPFVKVAVGKEVLQRLHGLIAAAHPKSLDWNPIQVYDFMRDQPAAVYSPWGFGYTNYSRAGNSVPLRFTDAPAAGHRGSAGTMLGGTGLQSARIASTNRKPSVTQNGWPARNTSVAHIFAKADSPQVLQPGRMRSWTQLQAASSRERCGHCRKLTSAPDLMGLFASSKRPESKLTGVCATKLPTMRCWTG